jgi:hypothetical protein
MRTIGTCRGLLLRRHPTWKRIRAYISVVAMASQLEASWWAARSSSGFLCGTSCGGGGSSCCCPLGSQVRKKDPAAWFPKDLRMGDMAPGTARCQVSPSSRPNKPGSCRSLHDLRRPFPTVGLAGTSKGDGKSPRDSLIQTEGAIPATPPPPLLSTLHQNTMDRSLRSLRTLSLPGSVVIPGLAVVIFLAVYRALRAPKTRNPPLPPSPAPEPFLGHYRIVPQDAAFKRYAEWGAELSTSSRTCPISAGWTNSALESDVLFFETFGTKWVVLNSLEAATELLEKRGSIYADRPRFVMFEE